MNTRAKGREYEREVADVFRAHGMVVRGLESGGDHFVVTAAGMAVHVEAKRQERVQLPIWLRQQTRDCPPNMWRVLAFRQNRDESYAVLPLKQYVRLLEAASHELERMP